MRKFSGFLPNIVVLFIAITTCTAFAEESDSVTKRSASPSTSIDSDSANVARQPEATLEQVLELAWKNAPEIIAAQASVRASRSMMVGARVSSVLNPYLEVIGERGGRGVTRDVYITGQLHAPVEVAGQRSRRIAEANSYVNWNEASFERMRAEFSGGVIRTYGDYVAAAARLETLAELRDSSAVEATTLAMRRDAGDATERDAQLAELERARIAVQVEEARAALSAARNELGRLTGQRVVAPNRALLFPQLVGVSASASDVTNSPIVRSAEAEARYFAQQDIRLERERIPPMSVILQAGRGDYGEARLGAGLAWTIPAFRNNQGERARAQAEVVRARAVAAAFRQSIALRLDAIAEEGRLLHAAFERIDQEAIPAAVLATNSATRMQQAGKTDLLSVVVARRDLSTLKLRRLDLASRAWTLLGDWVSLTGAVPMRK